jgi:hypothetical protein
MKKLLTMMVVGAMVATVSADLTSFSWSKGTPANSVTLGTNIYTMLDANTTADIFDYVIGGEIDIDDLALFSPYNTQAPTIGSGPNAGKWYTQLITGTGAVAGKYVYAINGTSSTFSGIAVGDTLKIFNVMGPLNELQAVITDPAGTPQAFTPTSFTSVTVIPEPATALLLGVGAMGAWMIRRNKLRSKEQADA